MADNQRAAQYIYQDGQWVRVGPTLTVASGGGGEGEPFKTIYLTKCYKYTHGYTYVLFCRVNFVNFTEEDVGKKIFLYRQRRRSKKDNRNRGWKHPPTWNQASGNKMMGFGYGMLAGKNEMMDGDSFTWPGINDYSPHNGYIETEWEITAEDIQAGYKDINISKMLIDLVLPSPTGSDINWNGNNKGILLIGRNHTVVFKFNVVDENGTQITFCPDKFMMVNGDLWSSPSDIDDIVIEYQGESCIDLNHYQVNTGIY